MAEQQPAQVPVAKVEGEKKRGFGRGDEKRDGKDGKPRGPRPDRKKE